MKPKHFRADEGRVNRELRDLRKQAREQAAGKRLQAATIGKGGLRVVEGGQIIIEDGGDLAVKFPDDVAEGQSAVSAGDIRDADTLAYLGTGLLVQATNGDDIAKFVSVAADGGRGHAEYGVSDAPIHLFLAYADSFTVETTFDFTVNAADDVSLQAANDINITAGGVAFFKGGAGAAVDGGGSPVTLQNGVVNILDGLQVQNFIKYFAPPTTAAGANVNYDLTDGRIRVVTSSERDKDIIGPAELDLDACEQLLEMMYTRKDEADQENPPVYLGFIAERAHELGLPFVGYKDGEPYTFDYPTFAAVAHHAMLRREREKLQAEREAREALEQTVADLAARVEALEAALAG